MSQANKSIERISEVAQQWFLKEPLLFAIWTTHAVTAQPSIATIRVQRGCVEFNPEFIGSLTPSQLRDVMKFEAIRIVLKHPYERRKPDKARAYEASNLSIQECARSPLGLPTAQDRFDTKDHDGKFFEW